MTRRRRSAVAALLAAEVALALSLAAAPAGATEDPAVPVDAVVVAETTPVGYKVHGAGESGTDNVSQIAGNQLAVAFAGPARQAEHPSFVLSPQRRPDMNWFWNDAGMESALLELIEETARRYPIDRDRIYVTGLSMGSLGWWAILPEHQDVFAGAILECGLGDEAAARSLTGLPVWATHSRDDQIVEYDVPGSDARLMRSIEAAGAPVTWGEWAGNLPDAEAEAQAAALRKQAEASGSRHLFTTFAPGTTPIFPHASWVPTYTNGVMLDWLFAQVRDSAQS